MSSLSSRRHRTANRPAWSGLAVVVEALTLLLALVVSLTILTQLFASAALRARDGQRLAAAVACATNAAERFAADPAHAEGEAREGDLTVSCAVSTEPTDCGTLYRALIRVSPHDSEDVVFELVTARYVREVAR